MRHQGGQGRQHLRRTGARNVGRAHLELQGLPRRHLAAGLDIRSAQEDAAAQQHVEQAPRPTDLNIFAGEEGGRGIP